MPVQRVKVVACSTACIPEELTGELDIAVIPMSLIIDGQVYRDGIDITGESFYGSRMYENPDISTSAPSAGAYQEAFESFAGLYGSVLCITMSTALSASYSAATAAAERSGAMAVRVVDSGTAASGLCQVVLAAARASLEGRGLDEVAARARAVAESVRLFATVETLEYLRKSGRVSGAAAAAAGALNIKPVLRMEDGELRPFAKALSKRRAVDRIVREAREESARAGPLHLAVFHAAVPEEALALKERLEAEVDHLESLLTYFTPVLGWATGPGFVGASFYAG